MISANELKRKEVIVIDAEPFQVLDVVLAPPSARGASTMVKVKTRHLLTGAVQDRSFKATEKFAEAAVETVDAQFLYQAGEVYCFMDQTTFETIELPPDIIGEFSGYLVEELMVKIVKYNEAPVALELPAFVNISVLETDPPAQLAGSAGSGTKQATLATGKVVRVPQYIAAGEVVRVNTETGEVAGRA